MEAYGKDLEKNDHMSVGMRRPNGDFERPILGKGLFWTKPGISIWFFFGCNLFLFVLFQIFLYFILFSIIVYIYIFYFLHFCIFVEFLFVPFFSLSKRLRNVITFLENLCLEKYIGEG